MKKTVSYILDNSLQKAYFYKSNSSAPKPLVVSLHTWSGNYKQKDACCSDLALGDIDDAINYAVRNSNVDLSRIYVFTFNTQITINNPIYSMFKIFKSHEENIHFIYICAYWPGLPECLCAT